LIIRFFFVLRRGVSFCGNCLNLGSGLDMGWVEFGGFYCFVRAFERLSVWVKFVDIGEMLIWSKDWDTDGILLYDTILAGLIGWFINLLMHKTLDLSHLAGLLRWSWN
jgi:hypothetical protein